MPGRHTPAGLTGGCAEEERAGCKFIEFAGDNVNSEALLGYAHDVIDLPLELDYEIDCVSAPVDSRALPRWNRGFR